MKAGIYIRVSMEDQDPENQLSSLEALCKARGWPIHKVYRDVITPQEATNDKGLLEAVIRGTYVRPEAPRG